MAKNPGYTCPTCGRQLVGPLTDWPAFPFCSPKCKLIDLGRWLDGRNNLDRIEPNQVDKDRAAEVDAE